MTARTAKEISAGGAGWRGASVWVVEGRRGGASGQGGLARVLASTLGSLPERDHHEVELMGADGLLDRGSVHAGGAEDATGGDGDGPAGPSAASAGPVLAVYVPCRRTPDPAQARRVAGALVRGGAAAVVLVGSTEICEPSHRSPGLLDEERVSPSLLGHPVARRWAAVEEGFRQGMEEGGAAVHQVCLRAAPVPFPGGDDPWSDLLSGAFSIVHPGRDPSLQLLSPPDLARAVAAALRRATRRDGRSGETFHVVPAGVVPLSWALRLAGVRKVPVPRLERWAHGRSSGDGRAAHLAHPWTASGEQARRVLGFAPRLSSAEVAAAMVEGSGWRAEDGWWAAPRRRLALEFDDHGLSTRYVGGFQRTQFRFLHDAWWRIEHRGVERVPRQGPVVLVGVHRGFMPWDGVMALHLVRREVGRTIRFLVHPALLKFPFLSNFMRRLGGVVACRENADSVLSREGVLGIFPEGIRGAFTRYEKAYRLGNFGRRDYLRVALAHGATLVPFVTVGSAEIYPILGGIRSRWVRRHLEWPYLPLTPTFPLLPVPLPTKWHTRFLEPVHLGEHGPQAEEDRQLVRRLGEEVEGRMQAALDEMVAARRSWWWGRIWEDG